jgi:hypothetical protein
MASRERVGDIGQLSADCGWFVERDFHGHLSDYITSCALRAHTIPENDRHCRLHYWQQTPARIHDHDRQLSLLYIPHQKYPVKRVLIL